MRAPITRPAESLTVTLIPQHWNHEILHQQNLLCKLGSKRDAILLHYGTLKEPISVLLEPTEILGDNQQIIGFEPNLVHLQVFIPNSVIISFVPSKKILKLDPSQLNFFIRPWSCEIQN